jgi:hypothetical protein
MALTSFQLRNSVLAEAFRSRLKDGLFADLLIRTGDGQQVHVHRLVLAAVSLTAKECLLDVCCDDQPIIILPDFTAEDVHSVLPFLYGGCGQDTSPPSLELVGCLQIGQWNRILKTGVSVLNFFIFIADFPAK